MTLELVEQQVLAPLQKGCGPIVPMRAVKLRHAPLSIIELFGCDGIVAIVLYR